MIKVYFIINKELQIITGVSRFPIDNTADYKNIEVEMPKEDFDDALEKYVYQDGKIVKA